MFSHTLRIRRLANNTAASDVDLTEEAHPCSDSDTHLSDGEQQMVVPHRLKDVIRI